MTATFTPAPVAPSHAQAAAGAGSGSAVVGEVESNADAHAGRPASLTGDPR